MHMCIIQSESGEILTHCPRLWPLSGVYNRQEISPGRGRGHNANNFIYNQDRSTTAEKLKL